MKIYVVIHTHSMDWYGDDKTILYVGTCRDTAIHHARSIKQSLYHRVEIDVWRDGLIDQEYVDFSLDILPIG